MSQRKWEKVKKETAQKKLLWNYKNKNKILAKLLIFHFRISSDDIISFSVVSGKLDENVSVRDWDISFSDISNKIW